MAQKKQTYIRRNYKYYLLGLFVILFCLIVGSWLFMRHFKPIFSRQIKKEVFKATDSLYHVNFSAIHLNPLSGNLTIDSLYIIPDTAQYNRLRKRTSVPDKLFDLKYGPFDLNELIEKRVSEVRLTSPDYKFIIEAGNIQTVSGDEERIGQVLTNLISNAVKYSPDADKVIISSEDIEGKKVKVCVRDFGPGLKPQLREKIFKRFYRSLNNGNASGFVLGLYISKEIIKLHFGEIGIESPETGSIFYFIIPYKP